jgi:hypothetical protein
MVQQFAAHSFLNHNIGDLVEPQEVDGAVDRESALDRRAPIKHKVLPLLTTDERHLFF